MYVAGSYAAGALGTLSRTLDDWIFVEFSLGRKEIIPFVYAVTEPGCIVWLGFSTCEEVQFEEWKLLLNAPEKGEIFLFNVSNPHEINTGATPFLSEMDPITMVE